MSPLGSIFTSLSFVNHLLIHFIYLLYVIQKWKGFTAPGAEGRSFLIFILSFSLSISRVLDYLFSGYCGAYPAPRVFVSLLFVSVLLITEELGFLNLFIFILRSQARCYYFGDTVGRFPCPLKVYFDFIRFWAFEFSTYCCVSLASSGADCCVFGSVLCGALQAGAAVNRVILLK